MQIVTLAEIILNRPGSIGGGFQRTVSNNMDPRKIATVVLNDDAPGDVLQKVKELAISYGEDPDELERLGVSTPLDAASGIICFKETHEPFRTGTQFGQHYAQCEVYTALEIEGRYFRMNEVMVSR